MKIRKNLVFQFPQIFSQNLPESGPKFVLLYWRVYDPLTIVNPFIEHSKLFICVCVLWDLKTVTFNTFSIHKMLRTPFDAAKGREEKKKTRK